MSILGCYGEDIDFVSAPSMTISTNSSFFRSGFARCALCSASYTRTAPFLGGAITSCWLSARLYNGTTNNGGLLIGLVNSTASPSGIWIGNASSSFPDKVSLFTYNGTTATLLASEAGNSFSFQLNHKLDVQLVNYGASATINVFLDGALVIAWSGNAVVAGLSNLDSVGLGNIGGNQAWASEIIVANEDTRSFSLFTMAPTAAGTTDQWSGAVTTINGITFSDTSPNYTNTAAQDQQADLTAPPTGIFAVKAVKISARSAASVGSTPTKIALGYNSGGTVGVDTAQTLGNSYATVEQIDSVNPATSAAWTLANLTGLQLDLRSST